MGEITVEFIGVCTHIQRTGHLAPIPMPHRAILINSQAQEHVHTHHTRVKICEGEHVLHSRDLNGATVSITGALDGTVAYDEHYNCAIPRLLLGGFVESMTLSRRVTESPDAALVSGLIDLPNASFTALLRKDLAAVALATVQIEGPRQITIRSFAGASEIVDECLSVPDGAVVVFSNTAEGDDDEEDFSLNFLIADPVPVIKRMHVTPNPCPDILTHNRDPWQSIGPGCSNTNFP